MATNVSGIAIVIKAFLPTGKTLDEQFEALSIVKDAHASGDYAKLLSAASIDEVKTEQKVRRMEDAPAEPVEGVRQAEAGEDSETLFDAGIDEPRVNPDDEPEANDDAPKHLTDDEPAPRRRMAR